MTAETMDEYRHDYPEFLAERLTQIDLVRQISVNYENTRIENRRLSLLQEHFYCNSDQTHGEESSELQASCELRQRAAEITAYKEAEG